MRNLINDPRITMHLLPLPTSHAKAAVGPSNKDKEARSPSGPGPFQPKKRPKAGAKAKAGCPEELKGYSQFDEKNQPICWAFNLSKGCSKTTHNGRCKKGAHVCINCKRNNHSLVSCRNKKN